IEGWELGRVARPPIHDVLRFAHFLGITADEIQAAVFADTGGAPTAQETPDGQERKKSGRRRRQAGAVPLLETGFRLFGWQDDSEAADALNTTPEQVRRWRLGAEKMDFPDFLALTSMIGVAAAGALRGEDARIADLSAAADALGLRAPS
ncbi:MAG: hypothetical protein ACRDLR_03685, partial [Gaiellaceae bacterium]